MTDTVPSASGNYVYKAATGIGGDALLFVVLVLTILAVAL